MKLPLYFFSAAAACSFLPFGFTASAEHHVKHSVSGQVRVLHLFDGLGECEYDCDRDRDCAGYLLCADEHKSELAAVGLDNRKANCGNVGSWNEEVCFVPGLIA
jgi:hypothetical protein